MVKESIAELVRSINVCFKIAGREDCKLTLDGDILKVFFPGACDSLIFAPNGWENPPFQSATTKIGLDGKLVLGEPVEWADLKRKLAELNRDR